MQWIKVALLGCLLTTAPLTLAETPTTPAPASAPASTAMSESVISPTLNINSASAAQLTQLKGIGPAKADAIVRFRDQHGPFKSLDELMMVKGIGERTVEQNRTIATVE